MNGAVRHTTLITSPNPAKMTPLEAAMMDACNILHEAVAKGDSDRIAQVRVQLAEMLDRYESTGADDHPQPKWAVPHQRALAMSAAGDLHQSIVYEEIALENAQTPRQLEISLGNLAERSMRVGRVEESIEYFFRARDAAPTSVPILLTGAQALFIAGFKKESDGIFRALLGMENQYQPGTELTAYLDFETRLHAMRRDLPSLDLVMRKWESLRQNPGFPSSPASTSPSKEVPCA